MSAPHGESAGAARRELRPDLPATAFATGLRRRSDHGGMKLGIRRPLLRLLPADRSAEGCAQTVVPHMQVASTICEFLGFPILKTMKPPVID